MMHHVFVVTNVWWRLLVTLVITKSHRHLVHIQRPIQVIQTILLEIRINQSSVSSFDIQIHFHVWISAVINCA